MSIDSFIVNSLQFDSLQNNIPSNPADAYMISLNDTVYNQGIKRITLNTPIKKFDAIVGSTLTNYAKNVKNVSIRAQATLSSKYRDSNYDLAALNSIGCYLSHISLWYKVITENLKGMYIFETDAYCLSTLDVTDFLKTDGDILLFGSRLIGDSFFVPGNYGRQYGLTHVKQHFYGLHAYYITYKGALKAIKTVFPIEAQVDAYLSYLSKLNLLIIYGYYPVICDQLGHISTVQSKPVKHYVDSILVSFGIAFFLIIIIIILIIMYSKK